ncbi:putative enzyme related to lactoylglutathione lyase [Kribbella aluminosa]|uniref:Enzyme related to lactoylglutathione lyase n=1 Tax=Kribbella aluminosa TaxID=416017 RepID=A0ABS4UP58_9ACTN|nr:VOC family protein [Kribbella aluminosa]MBP2353428.1 putative enzyme related to lactoylglutathione lyase [Kribbella aluminosa]
MLRGLATVSFYAADVKAARDWYEKLLGVEAYYAVPSAEDPAYVEFRIGDLQAELGIIDAKYATHQVGAAAGAIMYWHVDDLAGTLARLIELGATVNEDIVERGNNTGFRTASVVDPFGNLLGIMTNPHYIQVLEDLRSRSA